MVATRGYSVQRKSVNDQAVAYREATGQSASKMPASYYVIPDGVMASKTLNPSAKMLYGALLRYCLIYDADSCYPSQEKLCERLGLSPDTLTRATKQLLEAKLIMVDKVTRGSVTRLTYFVRSFSVDVPTSRTLRLAPTAFCGTNKEEVTRDLGGTAEKDDDLMNTGSVFQTPPLPQAVATGFDEQPPPAAAGATVLGTDEDEPDESWLGKLYDETLNQQHGPWSELTSSNRQYLKSLLTKHGRQETECVFQHLVGRRFRDLHYVATSLRKHRKEGCGRLPRPQTARQYYREDGVLDRVRSERFASYVPSNHWITPNA